MSFEPGVTLLMNGGSGLLLMAVGIAVYRLAPRAPSSFAFAMFAGFWGLRQILLYTSIAHTPDDPRMGAWYTAGMVANFGYLAGIVLMIRGFPSPLATKDRRLLILPSIAGVVSAVPMLAAFSRPETWAGYIIFAPSFAGVAIFETAISFGVIIPALQALTFVLAARFARVRDDVTQRQRGQIMIVSAGFITYTSLITAAHVIASPSVPVRIAGAIQLALNVLLAAMWLRNAARSEGLARASARSLAWAILATALVGMLVAAPAAGSISYTTGLQFGIARLLLIALVAYGIVRHQLLGVDVKVRWTISKTTLAAVFIAVFFIASEAAQQFFGETFGSAYLGIAAAGALVFAIAPLQRFADRVAAKAVPLGGQSRPVEPTRRADDVYRAMLTKFLADAKITRAEERALADLAAELGIDAGRAFRMREEIEANFMREAEGAR